MWGGAGSAAGPTARVYAGRKTIDTIEKEAGSRNVQLEEVCLECESGVNIKKKYTVIKVSGVNLKTSKGGP